MMPDQTFKSPIYSYELNSFNNLCFGNMSGGASYSAAIREHTIEAANVHFEKLPQTTAAPTAIISIPRGGVPTALAMHEAFTKASTQPLQVIHSQIKTQPDNLLANADLNDCQQLIIVDGIIGTGSTIVNHMKAIPDNWKGTVQVFANAAAALGLKKIQEHAETMDNPVHIAVGKVFPDEECEWVNCDGKQVYFVGYNSAKQIDYKLPDFGDHINLQP